MASLSVSGFTGHLLALNGLYQQNEVNHGKPTYKKQAEMDGTTQCCVYYWDERDGPQLAGWWMAPEVGGEQVWAHALSRNPTPPPSGWKVPWHSPTPDPKIIMDLKMPGGFGPTHTHTPHMGGQHMGGGGGYGKGKGKGNVQRPNMNDPRYRLAREKNMVQVNAGVTTAENAITKLTGPESKNTGFDYKRHSSMASSALASAQRCIDAHMKSGGLDEASVHVPRDRITELLGQLAIIEQAQVTEQKNKLEYLKTGAVKEFSDLVEAAEKLVDKTKDVAAIFTCEMADHIKPEDSVQAKEKTDTEALPAQEALKKARDFNLAKEMEMRQFPAPEVAPIRENFKPVQQRLNTAEKELLTVKAQAMNCFRKAQQLLAKKKREDEMKKAREERDRVSQWNKEFLGFAYLVTLVADDIVHACDGVTDVAKLREEESHVIGLKNELNKRQEDKDCLPQTKAPLMQFVRKVEMVATKIRLLIKEQIDKNHDIVRSMAVKVATAAKEKKGNQSEDEYFSKLAQKSEKMSSYKFERFIKSLGINCNSIPLLFSEACASVGPDCTELSKEEFALHVMHAYHSAVQSSPLVETEDPTSEQISVVEADSVVEVIDGPKDVNGLIRAKIRYTPKENEFLEGWVTMRAQAEDFLVRYSPHYVVLSETVLTDTFDLKDFKVVRRIKPNEKVRALKSPQLNTEAAMWRIYSITEQNEKVWVTIQSNRGTQLLKNVTNTIDESETKAIEFSEDKFNGKLKKLAVSHLNESVNLVDAVKDVTDKVEQKLAEFEALDEDGQEPTQAEVQDITTATETLFIAHKQAMGKAVTSVKLVLQSIKDIESGPFCDIKTELQSYQSFFTSTNADMAANREKQRKVTVSVTQKEYNRRVAREKSEQEELAKKLLVEVKPFERKIEVFSATVEEIEKRGPPTMADTIGEYASKLEELKADVKSLETAAAEVRAWLEENIPKSGKGPLQEAYSELVRHRQRCFVILQKCAVFNARNAISDLNLKQKIRVDFALALKAHVTKTSKTVGGVFETEFKTESVDLEKFVSFAEKILPDVPCWEAMLKSTVGSTYITKEHFVILSTVAYRCVKRALITDTIEVKTCKRLKKIEPEETVEVLKNHEIDPSTCLVRFKARASDGVEGYVTISGNKGSNYFKLQQNGYRVVKDTFFTEHFDMENLKLLRRLKEGTYLRGLSSPMFEEKGNLWRMKAQALDGKENDVGWVTVKGNQGSEFLVNCELPDDMPADEKDGDADIAADEEEKPDEEMAEAEA